MTNTAAPLESFGKIFQGDFIERNGMSLLQLASASGIPVAEIEAIIKDERPLTDASSASPGSISRTCTPSTPSNGLRGLAVNLPSCCYRWKPKRQAVHLPLPFCFLLGSAALFSTLTNSLFVRHIVSSLVSRPSSSE